MKRYTLLAGLICMVAHLSFIFSVNKSDEERAGYKAVLRRQSLYASPGQLKIFEKRIADIKADDAGCVEQEPVGMSRYVGQFLPFIVMQCLFLLCLGSALFFVHWKSLVGVIFFASLLVLGSYERQKERCVLFCDTPLYLGPSYDYPKCGELPKFSECERYGSRKNGHDTWIQVKAGALVGWIVDGCYKKAE